MNMAKNVIETTEVEDAILVPYAASQGSTVSDLISANGKSNVVQSAIRSFVSAAVRTSSVDGAIQAAVCKDENAVFNAVWNDWNGQKKFAGVIAVGLASKPAVAAPASGMPV
jgi:hypothetical protein